MGEKIHKEKTMNGADKDTTVKRKRRRNGPLREGKE